MLIKGNRLRKSNNRLQKTTIGGKNVKKLLASILALAMVFALVACGGNQNDTPSTTAPQQGQDATQPQQNQGSTETIALRVWGAEEDQILLKDLVEKFKAAHPDQTFDIQIGVESESTAKDTILTDVTAAADVYAFACDQLPDLVEAGAILALDENMDLALQNFAGKSLDDVKAANSEGSVASATLNGQLYAFPFSADGFFMFYDPDFVSAEDVQSWDTLLAAAQASGKKVGMTLASGWYLAGFYYGAGFTTGLNEDGTTAIDWNGTAPSGVTGVQVTQAMLDIAANPAFMAIADGDISNQIKSGSLCAAVSGCWDSQVAAEAFGDDYMACRLPSFTAGGQEVPGGAVASYKLMGVNPHSQNTGWAMLLAEFLTNEESQVARYTARQLPPCNLAASSDPAVASDKGVAGLADQSAHAQLQAAGGKYWDPTKSFGEQIAQGTIASDDASVQAALDALVAGVSAPLG